MLTILFGFVNIFFWICLQFFFNNKTHGNGKEAMATSECRRYKGQSQAGPTCRQLKDGPRRAPHTSKFESFLKTIIFIFFKFTFLWCKKCFSQMMQYIYLSDIVWDYLQISCLMTWMLWCHRANWDGGGRARWVLAGSVMMKIRTSQFFLLKFVIYAHIYDKFLDEKTFHMRSSFILISSNF